MEEFISFTDGKGVMKEEVKILANLLYKEWLKTHDPYEDDFLSEVLEPACPEVIFHIANNEIIIL